MNKRFLLFFGAAVALALVASLGLYRFLSEKNRAAEAAKLQTVGIVVAQVDLPLGSTINANQVGVSAWPKDTRPKDAFADPKALVGRTVMRDFIKGEPILDSKLVPTAGGGSGILALKVAPGMRAFAVKVNEVVGVGGFIVPGSRVDVLVTTAVSSQRMQEQVSKVVLENILVLAAGQAIEQKENKPVSVNTVTLAVTPEEAEKLALASNDGKIQLVMRNFSDTDNVATPGSDKARLLASFRGAPPPAAAPTKAAGKKRVARKTAPPAQPAAAARPAPEKKAFTVEVIKGAKRSEENFD